MTKQQSQLDSAAYGGDKWSPRTATHQEEIGLLWGQCGLDAEWMSLRQVLLHPPGPELTAISDPEAAQMLSIPDWDLARKQHNAIAQAYRDAGVTVHYVEPRGTPPPNLMFCADLFVMTPEGAILGRPASTVRAGEERHIARRLADLGIPILRTLRGKATFEGADLAWTNPHTALIGRGLRTNAEGVRQVSSVLQEMGVEAIPVHLSYGSMHLMGKLRFLDRDLAAAWPYRTPFTAVEALRERGFTVIFLPDESEAQNQSAFNFVTLGPLEILMAAGNPITHSFLESHGVTCRTVDISELRKAAGGIGCMTGVLERALGRLTTDDRRPTTHRL